jgi:hypothetical protein
MMMEANPFSKLCAQDCKGRAFCQKACVRRKIDRPIEIPEIQLYLANQAEKMAYELDISPKNGEKVVIIGDTPASLVAAVMLSLRGVLVQLFYIGAHEIDPHMQHILRVTSVDYTVVDSNSSLQGIHAKIGVIMAKESDVLQQSLCGCEKIFIAKYESKVVMIVHFVKKGMAMAEQVWAYIGKEARENE